MYRQYHQNPQSSQPPQSIERLSDGACIPFDPANTDYQNFKKQINADEAQLEDAEGTLMTADQAKEFVSKLA